MEEPEVVVLEKLSVAALEGRVQEPDQGHDRLRGWQGVGGPGQVKNVLHQITVELMIKTKFTKYCAQFFIFRLHVGTDAF